MIVKKYIVAIDQGTTSCRVILYNKDFDIVDIAQQKFNLIFPQDNWVEVDPMELWLLQKQLLDQILSNINIEEVDSIGITNQRETTVVWNQKTGIPIYNGIVWQDQRTINYCDELKNEEDFENYVKKTSGLVVDPYFSATKIHWILNKTKACQDDLCFGTIDSWLLWNLTSGDSHLTDTSNASRTMLFDIKNLQWDNKLLEKFKINKNILPKVMPSNSDFGSYYIYGIKIPIRSVLGDQQAALFGQQCYTPGSAKNTYGTGCFMLMNTGQNLIYSNSGLLSTIAWTIGNKTTYALEGSIFIAGSAIQWLRDNLSFFENAPETEKMANQSTVDNLFFVPAFSGLGAPFWSMKTKGAFFGITREVTKNDMTKAVLQAIAYRTCDIFKAMCKDANIELEKLLVDGGASANNFLMKFQSDILGVKVIRPDDKEYTALGTALMAGTTTNFWTSFDIDKLKTKKKAVFNPSMTPQLRNNNYKMWLKAIDLAQQWDE